MICTAGQFCTIPINIRILSQINYKPDLPSHWKGIGYKLIAEHKVANIACNRDDVEEKCFTMLNTWLETESSPCYCKPFAALEVYKHFDLIRKVKEVITP